jgi:hypothetical protein
VAEVVALVEEEVELVELLGVEVDEAVGVIVYKSNCPQPPHFAVPVVAAPIEPLQTSVQAEALVKLATFVTEDEPKLKTLPP